MATQTKLTSVIGHHQQFLLMGKWAVARVAANTVIEEPDTPIGH